MILRDYQTRAIAALYGYLAAKDSNPCIVIPTGGGKTPIMAHLCRDAVLKHGARVCILAHRRELLEQHAEKLHLICPEVEFGVYSAGLNKREGKAPIVLAGIQSVFRRAEELGHFDAIFVDEAHAIPPDGEGMYRTFLDGVRQINPGVRVVGFTATPYRMTSGMICAPENLLNEIAYEVGVKELIVDGYLSKLRSKSGKPESLADLEGIHTRGGEFVMDELEDRMATEELVASACAEIQEYAENDPARKKVLVFCCGVKHALLVQEKLPGSGFICGETPSDERRETLERFRLGDLRYLVNVNVLTEGFDAPNIDMIALCRATKSPGLYYQMVGRGLRTCAGKSDCLVLDFGSNIMRHGPIDKVRPVKEAGDGGGEAPCRTCPQCQEVILIAYRACPMCGYEFPRPVANHNSKAGTASVLSGAVKTEWYTVQNINYSTHTKKGTQPGEAPQTLRVSYRISFIKSFSEWICVEHDGYAGDKAGAWWRTRTDREMPEKARECERVSICLRVPTRIQVREEGDGLPKIIGYEWGAATREPGDDTDIEKDERPQDFIRELNLKLEDIPF